MSFDPNAFSAAAAALESRLTELEQGEPGGGGGVAYGYMYNTLDVDVTAAGGKLGLAGFGDHAGVAMSPVSELRPDGDGAFLLLFDATVWASASDAVVEVWLAKNGVEISQTRRKTTVAAGTWAPIGTTIVNSLTTDEAVSVFVKRFSDDGLCGIARYAAVFTMTKVG